MELFKTAIILAGGNSSRMGFDKQFLELHNERLLTSLANKLRRHFSHIIVVTNRPEEYTGSSLCITSDVFTSRGPAAGLHAGLLLAQSSFSYLIACDMPNINHGYIDYMQSMITKYPDSVGVVTGSGPHIEPFNAFYNVSLLPVLERHLQHSSKGLATILNQYPLTVIDEDIARKFSPGWEMFSNLNTKQDLENYTMKTEPCISEVEIQKFSLGVAKKVSDEVVCEHTLQVKLNGHVVKELICSPLYLEELAVGALVSEGILGSCDNLQVSVNGAVANVTTNNLTTPRLEMPRARVKLNPKLVVKLMREFSTLSQIFARTGGVHSAALATCDGIIAFYDDIGRHNAIDKAIGHATICNLNMDSLILLTSGRVSTELLAKPLRVGIPCVVSKAAVTLQAVSQARKAGVTVVGFARGDRFNVYSGDICDL